MINSLLITHNDRLRCFITKLFNNSNIASDIIKKKQFKEYRWQNCCVLKLLLIHNSDSTSKKFNFELSLIYDGEIFLTTKYDGYQYWGNTQIQSNNNKCIGDMCNNKNTMIKKIKSSRKKLNFFEVLKGSINLIDLIDINIKNIEHVDLKNINNELTFYLVRHGQAEHNLYTKTTVFRKKDTSLTSIGIKQAINAGFVINKYLGKGMLNYYFTSDLIRTRQTLSNILSGIKSSNLTFDREPNTINLLVIPCSHELHFVSDGKCDSSKHISQVFSSENKMSCTKFNKYIDKTPRYKDCVSFNTTTSDNMDIIVNIDWSFYTNFYGTYRGNETKKQCYNTSMLEESIKYIISKNYLLKQNSKKSKQSKKIKKSN
jgi:bisphosphoglycerate-dependent phosphoglycerate mutase